MVSDRTLSSLLILDEKPMCELRWRWAACSAALRTPLRSANFSGPPRAISFGTVVLVDAARRAAADERSTLSGRGPTRTVAVLRYRTGEV